MFYEVPGEDTVGLRVQIIATKHNRFRLWGRILRGELKIRKAGSILMYSGQKYHW